MKVTTIYCDVCRSEENITSIGLQVLFTTEQTEGRSVTPYPSYQLLDVCEVCVNRVRQGEAIWASGAQGYNTYKFKEIK